MCGQTIPTTLTKHYFLKGEILPIKYIYIEFICYTMSTYIAYIKQYLPKYSILTFNDVRYVFRRSNNNVVLRSSFTSFWKVGT